VIEKTSGKITAYGKVKIVFKGKIIQTRNSLSNNANFEYVQGNNFLLLH
jgi:hypothetical protein